MRLVLEAGPAPIGTQMILTFTIGHPGSDKSDMEVMVDMKTTVLDCLTITRIKAGLQGECNIFALFLLFILCNFRDKITLCGCVEIFK